MVVNVWLHNQKAYKPQSEPVITVMGREYPCYGFDRRDHFFQERTYGARYDISIGVPSTVYWEHRLCVHFDSE